ncbi:hypothetical protein CLCR_07828 [Cladophialophora carrionii]|uniref:Uncharacterized protein n=1 Tax=Cladophialophora carrionii TaxID=86049 RepID=A0A1C1CPC8_9EURO|nr:hypothetical protein CLCR_07828 [Cladophialophora carrionii]
MAGFSSDASKAEASFMWMKPPSDIVKPQGAAMRSRTRRPSPLGSFDLALSGSSEVPHVAPGSPRSDLAQRKSFNPSFPRGQQ